MKIPLEKSWCEMGRWFVRSIRTVSKISNWHLSEVWVYSNAPTCRLCLIIIPLKNRWWEIRIGFGQLILIISTIIDWYLCDVWAYYNRQNCALCLMIIPRKNRGWKIGRGFGGYELSQQSSIKTSLRSEPIPTDRTVDCAWWYFRSKTGGGRLGRIFFCW